MITSQKSLARIHKICASPEHPYLVCQCGLATDKVVIRNSPTLRRSPNADKQKTWTRLVKYSKTKTSTYHRRICRAKEIVFSYLMLDCIAKKHKITIRRAPFSSKLVSVIK